MSGWPVPRKTKVVKVQVNPSGIRVDPEIATLSKSQEEQIRWQFDGPNISITIDFGNGSPFSSSRFSVDNQYSGPIRPEVVPDAGRIYKYSVTAEGKTLDPGVIILP